MPDVTIIIVNYNGEQYVKRLFESLSNQTYKDFEVIVVDNLSMDKSLEYIQKFKGKLKLRILKNSKNMGFCYANNSALHLSLGKWVVFLNNDTYVADNWLEELVKRAVSPDNPAIVVSQIVDEGSQSPNYGCFFDIYGASLSNHTYKSDNFFYGCGASLLVEKDVLSKIGGLDVALFMYQDDTDLCWQTRLLNRKIVCSPLSICYHIKPRLGIESLLDVPVWKFYLAHPKNRVRVAIKNYSTKNLLKRLPIVLNLICLRSWLLTFRNKTPVYLQAVAKGFLWNITNLENTLKSRYIIQQFRTIDDDKIQNFLVPFSIEIYSFKGLKNVS